MIEGLKNCNVSSRSSNTESESVADTVAEEVPIAISYNGASHAVMMATPAQLDDFAYGFSLTEGIIQNANDLLNVEIQPAKQGIALLLTVTAASVKNLASRKRSLTGRAGCGICGLSELSAAVPTLDALKPNSPPKHTAVERAVAAMQPLQILQLACGGIHGAALCTAEGKIKAIREDVGRHNALDKLIGAVLRESEAEKNLHSSDFILMSSRASHELVNKSVIAGASSLVTLSAATTLAIDVARSANLNLIGFVRGQRQLIYYQNL